MKRRQEGELIFSFLLRLNEVKSGKGEKTVILFCLMRSDFGNLPHVLKVKNKSSTFGPRGRVECKVPVYFWLNFKLKREQEITVEPPNHQTAKAGLLESSVYPC